MCAHKFSAYQYFAIILILLMLAANIDSSQTRCAGFSEYCQTHWDCCSYSCHSYLMRCTRGYATYPFSFIGVTPEIPPNAVQSTLEEILEINFGKRNLKLDNTIIQSRSNAEEKQQWTKDQGEQNLITSTDATTSAFNTEVPDSTTAKAIEDCKAIGEKCFNHYECCSKLCHGFLHQCVT